VSLPTLKLPAFLEGELSRGHPWVYRDHVPSHFRARQGSFVRVTAGNFNGFALWDSESPIALRLYSRVRAPDAGWVRERVRAAKDLRSFCFGPETNAYRLLFGEGDGLPGITADIYGGYAALVTYADSVDTLLPWVVSALEQELDLDGVVRRRRRADSDGEARTEALVGKLPEPFVVVENGMKMEVDLIAGQKTGLFLDHRDNRATVRRLAPGRRVLNLFSYTGAFSLAAVLGGATRVVSVDSAAPASEAARRNFALNGVDPQDHEFEARDAFEYLEECLKRGRTFDLVIADPPSFAGGKQQLKRALRAYTRLHALCLRVTEPGGLYCAASCTAQVSPDAFRETLADAGERAKVDLFVVHDAGHAFDHPMRAAHPEGRYLKFMVTRALDRA
jgi:23S rRNA (cytosine1962-C5)-methyltransferase